jgi:hypothetical protein
MNQIVRRSFWIVGLLAVALTACKDKEAEKKIAALEARLSEVEGKRSSAPLTSPAAQPLEEEKPEGPLAAIQFEKVEHDFGTIKEGEKVIHTYKFRNTGEAPLIIQNAQPTCGCTVPDWSKEPIPVGGEGFVKAEFDSQGKPGVQNKTVTVTSNTYPKQTVLSFKAVVTPKSTPVPAQ